MKPNESDLILLINHVRTAPRIYLHCPGRGDPEPSNNCELKVSLEQRNMIVRALECLRDVNRK
jgi:hypothetical protein